MPVLPDTDHISVLQWRERPACDRLLAPLDRLPADDIATSIVSFQEQVQGWQAYLNRARKPDEIVRAYEKLEAIWRSFLKMNVLPFSVQAESCFARLRPHCRRMQTLDLRIASVALVTDSVLLSRNRRDFQDVPGLSVEDWTA